MPGKKSKKVKIVKPFLFTVYYFIFFLIPPVNYFLLSFRNEIPVENIYEIFSIAAVPDWFLMVPPLLIIPGISLLYRWAWVLTIAYSLYSIFLNSYIAILEPTDYNMGAIAQALFSMLVLSYFSQNEIRGAFFKKGFMGWRIADRYNYKTEININGQVCECVDLSPGGCGVYWPDCPLKLNMDVFVSFQLRKKKFNLKGRIVRFIPSGDIGIIFTDTKAETKKILSELLVGIK